MVSVMVDPSFSKSIWCISMYDGLVSQLKLKRLTFQVVDSLEQLDPGSRFLFLIGADNTWVHSALEKANELGVYPILLCNEAYHTSSLDYSTVCSDVIGSMLHAVESLRQMNRHRIALYGINPQSIADQGRLEAYLAAVDKDHSHIFYNNGSLEKCYQEFMDFSAGMDSDFDAIICANSLTAISMIRRLLVDDPNRLEKLLIFGYQEVRLSALYDRYFHTIQLNFDEYGKAAVMILDNLKKNGNISHMIIAIKWDNTVVDNLRGKRKKFKEGIELDRSLPNPGDVFYEDNEINEMMLLEKLLYESEDLDKQIVRYLLEGDSYEQIAEKSFLTVSTVKYRVKKMVSHCRLNNRSQLLELLRRYIPEGSAF